MTTDSSPGPEGEPSGPQSVPDEVWDRFLKDSERDIEASAPKEPSAHARAMARLLREEGEWADAHIKRRTGRPVPPPGPPASRELMAVTAITARRAGRSKDEERRQTRARRLRNLLGILLVLAMVVIALSPSRTWSIVTGKGLGNDVSVLPAPTASLGPETAQPTGPPDSLAHQVPTLKRPFAGSPAEAWADGADGIVPPAATAYSAVSRQRMAQALDLVKKFLVAADLDPAVLAGGSADAAVGLIDPQGGDARQSLLAGLAHPTARHNPATLLSRFGPEVRLVGDAVKVRGRMTVDKGSTYGGARILADYTFVYPLRQASGLGVAQEIARTVVRRTFTVELTADTQLPPTPGTLDLSAWDSLLADAGCGFNDGFLHPYFADGRTAPGGPTPTVSPSGPTADPYDRSRPLAPTGADPGCVSASRT